MRRDGDAVLPATRRVTARTATHCTKRAENTCRQGAYVAGADPFHLVPVANVRLQNSAVPRACTFPPDALSKK
jgi:hypothetical protein